jgi:hypothetical protein
MLGVFVASMAGAGEYRNVAKWRVAYASSTNGYDRCAHLVTDGIIETAVGTGFASVWSSGTRASESIWIDLGAPSEIDKVVVYWFEENFAADYNIQVSDDGITWTTVGLQTGSSGGTVETLFGSVTASFVKIEGTRRSGSNYVITEIEVWGTNDLEYALPAQPAGTGDVLELTGGNWKLQRASLVTAEGGELSQGTYDFGGWVPAVVPGTVLTSYLELGAVTSQPHGVSTRNGCATPRRSRCLRRLCLTGALTRLLVLLDEQRDGENQKIKVERLGLESRVLPPSGRNSPLFTSRHLMHLAGARGLDRGADASAFRSSLHGNSRSSELVESSPDRWLLGGTPFGLELSVEPRSVRSGSNHEPSLTGSETRWVTSAY